MTTIVGLLSFPANRSIQGNLPCQPLGAFITVGSHWVTLALDFKDRPEPPPIPPKLSPAAADLSCSPVLPIAPLFTRSTRSKRFRVATAPEAMRCPTPKKLSM